MPTPESKTEMALCIRSHDLPRAEGGFRRFEAGTSYPLAELKPDQLANYFEHPIAAPPRRTLRRDEPSTDEQEQVR